MLKERVAAVETPDPARVRFRLKEPWPDFLTFYTSATGAGWIVPKKYVEKVGDEGFKKAPIGAGPYKFVSFTPGRRAGARGLRPVLAQDAQRQAPGLPGRSPTSPRGWPRSSAARSTSPTRSAASSPRSCSARRGSRSSPRSSRPRSGSTSPTSGIRSRRGTIGGCGRPRACAIDRNGDQPGADARPFAGSPAASSPSTSTSSGSRPPPRTTRPGPSSCSPRPATPTASTPATTTATPPTPTSPRPSSTTSRRSASA